MHAGHLDEAALTVTITYHKQKEGRKGYEAYHPHLKVRKLSQSKFDLQNLGG